MIDHIIAKTKVTQAIEILIVAWLAMLIAGWLAIEFNWGSAMGYPTAVLYIVGWQIVFGLIDMYKTKR